MSLLDIEEVKKLDPHIDPIDVSRLMFTGVTEGIVETLKHGPKQLWPPPDPLSLVVGTVFLLVTLPIGGVAEGVQRTYKFFKTALRGRT